MKKTASYCNRFKFFMLILLTVAPFLGNTADALECKRVHTPSPGKASSRLEYHFYNSPPVIRTTSVTPPATFVEIRLGKKPGSDRIFTEGQKDDFHSMFSGTLVSIGTSKPERLTANGDTLPDRINLFKVRMGRGDGARYVFFADEKYFRYASAEWFGGGYPKPPGKVLDATFIPMRAFGGAPFDLVSFKTENGSRTYIKSAGFSESQFIANFFVTPEEVKFEDDHLVINGSLRFPIQEDPYRKREMTPDDTLHLMPD